MPRTVAVVIIITCVCFITVRTYCQTNPEDTNYTDPNLGGVIKVRPASVFSGYFMAGFEAPIGNKNKYFDFNIGIPGLGAKRPNSTPGGILIRTGVKMPMIHTSPYSIIYWMPEYSWGTFRKKDVYNYCYSCTMQPPPEDMWIRQWAISIDFGYRHVNPATYFYYEIGVGLGYGGLSRYSYDLIYNQTPIGANYYSQDSRVSGVTMTGHIALGKALRRKNKK